MLPEIPDDAPQHLKNGIAIRNACSTSGVCPDCGARGHVTADPVVAGAWHYVFEHETDCGCLTDDRGAA